MFRLYCWYPSSALFSCWCASRYLGNSMTLILLWCQLTLVAQQFIKCVNRAYEKLFQIAEEKWNVTSEVTCSSVLGMRGSFRQQPLPQADWRVRSICVSVMRNPTFATVLFPVLAASSSCKQMALLCAIAVVWRECTMNRSARFIT
jgi:hypothetical protein